jgi:hypothetical protein
VDADFYLRSHIPADPLLKAETISRGIQAFFANYPAKIRSSLSLAGRPAYDNLEKPLNHNPLELIQTRICRQSTKRIPVCIFSPAPTLRETPPHQRPSFDVRDRFTLEHGILTKNLILTLQIF